MNHYIKAEQYARTLQAVRNTLLLIAGIGTLSAIACIVGRIN